MLQKVLRKKILYNFESEKIRDSFVIFIFFDVKLFFFFATIFFFAKWIKINFWCIKNGSIKKKNNFYRSITPPFNSLWRWNNKTQLYINFYWKEIIAYCLLSFCNNNLSLKLYKKKIQQKKNFISSNSYIQFEFCWVYNKMVFLTTYTTREVLQFSYYGKSIGFNWCAVCRLSEYNFI